MIEPTTITNFHRNEHELEQFMLFCIAVAGHNSTTTARLVNQFVHDTRGTPLLFLKYAVWNNNRHNDSSAWRANASETIAEHLEPYSLGPYKQNASALAGVMGLNLRTCTLLDLLQINGIGHKTARMFLLHSRPNEEHIVLDVHVLRYLRKVCRLKNIPEKTPPKLSQTYLDIENRAKRYVRAKYPGLSFAEFDLGVWKQMSGRN